MHEVFNLRIHPFEDNVEIDRQDFGKPSLEIACVSFKDGIQTPNIIDAAKVTEFNLDSGGAGRGFFEDPPGRIILITDKLFTAKDVTDTLTHEFVHATDTLIHKLDLKTCGGLACSEIRAASLAECVDKKPNFLYKHCVRSTAGLSTSLVFSGIGKSCVQAMFDTCQLQRDSNIESSMLNFQPDKVFTLVESKGNTQ